MVGREHRLPGARGAAGYLVFLVILAACNRADSPYIEGVGTLEVVEVDLAPALAAKVIDVRVREGDSVAAGDTVAIFSIPTLDAELDAALAEESAARASLAELQAGARTREIQRAEAELAVREAEHRRAVDDSTRLAPLVAREYATQSQMVAARSAVLAAAAARDAAAAQLALLREGTRPERIASGRALVQRAHASIAATRATAADLVLRSTVDGIVVTRAAEPGEVLAAGRAVVTIANVRRPWVRVYLGPQHLPLVNVGDTARAMLDAFPDRAFSGVVTAISTRAEYTPRVALTERERADLLYGVRIDFVDTTEMLKAGLPITVRFARDTTR